MVSKTFLDVFFFFYICLLKFWMLYLKTNHSCVCVCILFIYLYVYKLIHLFCFTTSNIVHPILNTFDSCKLLYKVDIDIHSIYSLSYISFLQCVSGLCRESVCVCVRLLDCLCGVRGRQRSEWVLKQNSQSAQSSSACVKCVHARGRAAYANRMICDSGWAFETQHTHSNMQLLHTKPSQIITSTT